MPRDPLIQAVADALRDRCHIRRGDRLLVAVSGGVDSVALLRALHALACQPHWSLDLRVAHVNHKLRTDSDEDEAFVAELAKGLGLAFHRSELDVVGEPGNREAACRRGRYAALARIVGEVDADAVAVAHHADDQLETLLMRLVRGASVRGLSGMAWRRKLSECKAALIRPMLGVERRAAEEYLRQVGQAWREDSTNTDLSRWRARLRADVLPVLRDLRPSAAVKASQSADRLREAARLVQRLVRTTARMCVNLGESSATLNREVAKRLDPELLRALVRDTSRKLAAPADSLGADAIQRIADAIRDQHGGTRSFHLAGNLRVTVTAASVAWTRYDPADEAHDQR